MRRPTHIALGAVTLALITGVGCASSGAGTERPAEEQARSPRMISRLTPPRLRIPSIPLSGRPSIRVRFEVLIDAEGRPDMKTFKATGMGAAENHNALAQWIEMSAFAPATRGGIAVPGVFRGGLQVRVSRTP